MSEEIKLPAKLDKVAKEIEGLTAIELAELAKYMEDKFGISNAPMAAMPVAGAPVAVEPQEEKTSFTVVLSEAGANKLAVIKAVREIDQNLGLMEAKKLVESAPKELLKDAKKKLETAGAKVELK